MFAAVSRRFLPFGDALMVARGLRLKTAREYYAWCKGGTGPASARIPVRACTNFFFWGGVGSDGIVVAGATFLRCARTFSFFFFFFFLLFFTGAVYTDLLAVGTCISLWRTWITLQCRACFICNAVGSLLPLSLSLSHTHTHTLSRSLRLMGVRFALLATMCALSVLCVLRTR